MPTLDLLKKHRSTLLLLAALAASCTPARGGGGGGGGGDEDSGAPTDQGAPVDRGAPTDNGIAVDAGNDTGTITPTDVPMKRDVGVIPDDVGTQDAGTPTDLGNVGQDIVVINPTDTGNPTDAGNLPDVSGPYDPCASGSVIDLATAGTRVGSTTRYLGSNVNVPAGAVLPSACAPYAGHQVAFRYVPTMTGRLRVSTDNAGTGQTDTVVFVQSACARSAVVDGGVQDNLGCNDDNGTMGATRPFASTAATGVVTAGQPIYIIVAGYLGMDGRPYMTNVPRGPFELTVTELTPVANGAACDGVNTVCNVGSLCILAMAGATMGTCIANGSNGGVCRTSAPVCDTGLECSGTGFCGRGATAGTACVPGALTGRCMAGLACSPTSRTAGTCVAGINETEPNNTPTAPQAAVATSRVYAGSVEASGQDCFAVTIPQGGGVFAESNLSVTPDCPDPGSDPVLSLYNASGTLLTSVDDTTNRGLCSTLNPSMTAAANNLAAGNYVVCISGYQGSAVPNYVLTVGVYPAQ